MAENDGEELELRAAVEAAEKAGALEPLREALRDSIGFLLDGEQWTRAEPLARRLLEVEQAAGPSVELAESFELVSAILRETERDDEGDEMTHRGLEVRQQVQVADRQLREKVLQAFEVLRSEGVLVAADHLCCMNCAWEDLTGQMNERDDILGAVYWHHQDEERLWYHDFLSVRFIDNTGRDDGPLALGRRAARALTAQGLTVEWNDDPDKVIEVYP